MFDKQKMAKEEFKKKVIEFIKKRYPGATVTANEDFSLAVSAKGGQQRVFLDNIYATACEGRNWEQQLSHLVDAPGELELGWESARTKLFPQIRNGKFIAEANALVPKDQQLAAIPFVEDLFICWAVDLPETIHYVNLKQAKVWKKEPGELLDIALKNLARQTEAVPFKKKALGSSVMLYWDTGDGYDTSRLLLLLSNKNAYHAVAKVLGERFVAGLPTRDMLLLAPAAEAKNIQQFVTTAFQKLQRGISPHLFVIRQTGPERWTGK